MLLYINDIIIKVYKLM